jgi:hypothetical protein
MSYVTKQKQENTMKRVSFALILVLLSFGLSYGLDITAEVTDGLWYDGGAMVDKINTGVDVTFSFSVSYTVGDSARLPWSSPFVFYGTGGITTLAGGAGTFVNDASFDAYWDMTLFHPNNNANTLESWDGDLTNNDPGPPAGLVGDLFNYTGVDFNAPHLPNSGTDHCFDVTFTAPFTQADSAQGDFCVAQGDFVNDTYDWLFDDPQPVFTTVCHFVETVPDLPPTFDNCPTAAIVGQYSDAFGYDLDATDPDATPGGISYSKVSGPGAVDPGTGMWTWQPDCGDVGSHTVVVCATDAKHNCPTGEECTFTVQVNNTDPVINTQTSDCGKTIIVGTNATKMAEFFASDANGGTLTWSAWCSSASPDPPCACEPDGSYGITQAGVFSFSPTTADDGCTYCFTIRVTDCAGGYDECEVCFTVLGQLKFDIVIEKVEKQIQGHIADVRVYKRQGTEEMWGFDFLIGYDNSALTFLLAEQGLGIDDWEYFTYRYNWNGNCGNGCPSGLLTVTALADQNDGPNHPPAGFGVIDDTPFPDPIVPTSVLFTLKFLVTNNYNFQSQFVPINFYWVQCQDNAIAFHYKSAIDPLEIRTALSKVPTDGALWYNGWDPADPYLDVTDPYYGFPTWYGAQMECFCSHQDSLDLIAEGGEAKLVKCPVPFVDFYGGGIDIIPIDSLDDRGDVNLNGVANEIADAVVFTNYFIYGPDAFTINFEGQKAATEINGDGIALTVADLVYLIRIIVGDALALPPAKPVPTVLNVTSGEVTVDNPIGAGHFVFAGNVDVTLAEGANGMELLTNYHDGQTHAILYSFEKDVVAEGHILTSTGQLVSVDAADYDGANYSAKMVPGEFSVNNYPNPFNPVATVEMRLPSASDWTVTVFNVVGQRVADFNGHSDAGVVKVQWDASNEASGIYFYKVDAGQYSVTKKMVLLK